MVQLVFTFKQQCLSLVHTTCHHSVPSLTICPPCSDLLSTSSNSECQDGLGGHTDCPFQRRIIPAHRLRPRRTHPEIFQVFNLDHRFKFFPVAKQPAKEKKICFFHIRKRTRWTTRQTRPLRRSPPGRSTTNSDFILGSGSIFCTTDSHCWLYWTGETASLTLTAANLWS